MPADQATSYRVDAFVRRQSLWANLLDIFRHHRPTEDQLTQVSTIAEVAIDRVFEAHRLTEAQQLERHGVVKDYCEASALYGYTLGFHHGMAAARQQLVPLPLDDPALAAAVKPVEAL